jgi:hypothetical protein
MILVLSNQMNLALGVLFSFLGWAFLAYVGCRVLLSLYDGGRYPVQDISEADRKANAMLRNKYSIVGGLVAGMLFLFLRYGSAL